jgi:hypothetical protein
MVGVWLTLLVLICARAALWPKKQSVYPIFSDAGQNWVRGDNLYDEHFLLIGIDQYRYSPLATVFFVPISYLPDAVGGVLWRLFNMAVFFGGFAAYARTVWPGRPALTAAAVGCLGWLLLTTSLGSLNNGQANPLVIGALLFAVTWVHRGRWNAATLALCVAIFLKIYPVAMALLLVVAFPRQLGWRLVLFVAVGLALPFAFQRPAYVADQYRQWLDYLANEDRSTRRLADSYRDFHLLLRWVGLPASRGTYLAVQLAAAAAVAAMVQFGRLRRWPRRALLHHLFNLGCLWIILFGPATENCTYILLAPTLAFAVWEAFAVPRPLWTRGLLTAIVCIFVAGAVITALPGGRDWTYPLNPLAALLLFGERLLSLRAAARPRPQKDAIPGTPARAA